MTVSPAASGGFADADAVMWADGELVRAGDARLPVLDHAITVGDAAFDALKVVHGRPFALRRHLDRLARSADLLELPALDRGLAERAVAAVMEANVGRLTGSHDIMRLTYTAGTAPVGSDRASQPQPRLLVTITHHEPPAASGTAITVPWSRNEHGALAGIKSTSYAENARALARARAAGADEALFPNTAGRLCEGTRSNVFVVLDGRLLTPPLADGPLAGVTRELLLEWTDAIEESLPMPILATADEVFIASTGNDVLAMAAIDGRPVGDGAVGPVTRQVAAAFAAGQARDLDP
ncbi:MAG: aminotransferase class IV [Propionibacteriaceae bacterium]|jgi:branched-chain amino acid aminotransferase|nr:aminotransferase class IV [Propionibacteriaceae bacterium]